VIKHHLMAAQIVCTGNCATKRQTSFQQESAEQSEVASVTNGVQNAGTDRSSRARKRICENINAEA
jgi:hypothetical protein